MQENQNYLLIKHLPLSSTCIVVTWKQKILSQLSKFLFQYQPFLHHTIVILKYCQEQFTSNMQNNEVISTIILIENEILLLAAHWQHLATQLSDRKDLMRKLREQQIKPMNSTYCLASGAYVKKKPQEIYPMLERQVAKLTKERDTIQQQLLKEMKSVTELLRSGKIGAGQLDSQVRSLLSEFELNFEDELMGDLFANHLQKLWAGLISRKAKRLGRCYKQHLAVSSIQCFQGQALELFRIKRQRSISMRSLLTSFYFEFKQFRTKTSTNRAVNVTATIWNNQLKSSPQPLSHTQINFRHCRVSFQEVRQPMLQRIITVSAPQALNRFTIHRLSFQRISADALLSSLELNSSGQIWLSLALMFRMLLCL